MIFIVKAYIISSRRLQGSSYNAPFITHNSQFFRPIQTLKKMRNIVDIEEIEEIEKIGRR